MAYARITSALLALPLLASVAFAEPPRDAVILEVGLETGMGHVTQGQGFEAGAKQFFPPGSGVQVKHLELVSLMDPMGKLSTQTFYNWVVDNAPRLYSAIYDHGFNFIGPSTLRRLNASVITPRMIKAIQDAKPDTVICMHVIASLILEYLRKLGYIPANVRIVNWVTDNADGSFYNTGDIIVLPSQHNSDNMRDKWNVRQRRLRVVSGLIPRPDFLVRPTEEQIVAIRNELNQELVENPKQNPWGLKLHIESDRPTFVVSGGGEGMRLERIVDYIPDWAPDRAINVAFICGNNTSLLQRVAAMVKGGKLNPNLNLIPLPFQKEMHKWIKIARNGAVIAKPGGSTFTEATAAGVAHFVHDFIDGQERKNLELGLQLGVLHYIENMNELDKIGQVMEIKRQLEAAQAREYPQSAPLVDQIGNIILEQYKISAASPLHTLTKLDCDLLLNPEVAQ